ncbi:hypothetical protein [Nocardia pneumoniae]|nr:hypothetical protein [Nocardia pneumoniae]
MATGEVIAVVAVGIVVAAVLCMVALLIAVWWTRRHPDHRHRKTHRRIGA